MCKITNFKKKEEENMKLVKKKQKQHDRCNI